MDIDKLFAFEKVALFGRSLDEYRKMFNLNIEDLKGKRILDCNGGPSSFACEAAALGLNVTACDPMYALEIEPLRRQIDSDAAVIEQKHATIPNLYHPGGPTVADRRRAMETFLSDFQSGLQKMRYISGQLPDLPFADNSFDLVLSSNFLFIYSDQASGGMMAHDRFNYDFHREAVAELIRVCLGEVRIYPVSLTKETSHQYLKNIMKECHQNGHTAELLDSAQRDIQGSEQFLRIICNKG
jgi:predicted RNA methylase